MSTKAGYSIEMYHQSSSGRKASRQAAVNQLAGITKIPSKENGTDRIVLIRIVGAIVCSC